jgi:hypothetical protein
LRISLDLDENVAALVLDEAREAQSRGQSMDKGPEAHTLNEPRDDDAATFHQDRVRALIQPKCERFTELLDPVGHAPKRLYPSHRRRNVK